MGRAVCGAVAGALLAILIAVPIYLWAIAAEQAAMRRARGEGDHVAELEFVLYSHHVHLGLTAGGFGGVIGSIVGATSAVVTALKRRDGPSRNE
jgi:hypothetical protein